MNNQWQLLFRGLTIAFLATVITAAAQAADGLRPYVMGASHGSDFDTAVDKVKEALNQQGFTIAGEYSPQDDAQVIVVTSEALKANAAKSEFGGYGVAQRVSVTQVGDAVQVAYTNPIYMAAAYRMEGDLQGVKNKLQAALGNEGEFGSEEGFTEKDLRKYHYMMMMPYFDDHIKLASYDSYDAAMQAVEAGLGAGKGGTSEVYRIDVPGKDETLIGVALTEGEGADKTILETIDKGDKKHTAYLPYEILVSGGNVYALHGKFRIALSFPDLSMGTFMKISNAPDAIEKSLKAAAGG